MTLIPQLTVWFVALVLTDPRFEGGFEGTPDALVVSSLALIECAHLSGLFLDLAAMLLRGAVKRLGGLE
jgi:hypothetical protein